MTDIIEMVYYILPPKKAVAPLPKSVARYVCACDFVSGQVNAS